MKKLLARKELLLAGVVALLFIAVSLVSLVSIRYLQGNARVVNYVGIVRGATQKLVKKELMGYPDDALIARLDGIIAGLLTGEGEHDLVVLEDAEYLTGMRRVQTFWISLKKDIMNLREGGDGLALYSDSEAYFDLVNDTVFAAEAFSERQVDRSVGMLGLVNAAFVVLMVVGIVSMVRTMAIKRRAEALGKLAYIDQLTQLPNRASCQRLMDRLQAAPPKEPLAVFMFDMNGVKRVNDEKGHQGGDRLIADFATMLREISEPYGFVGRYGGDEFIAIFEDCSSMRAEQFLARFTERTVSYNLLRVDDLERVSFAAGFVVDTLSRMPLLEMIDEADRRMYARKHQMKEERRALDE